MTENNTKSAIGDRVTLTHYSSDKNKTGVEKTYAHLTFGFTESEESISIAALKLLGDDLQTLLMAVDQRGLAQGAVFPGKHHGNSPNVPEEWVKVDCHVNTVSPDGYVTEAAVNLEFAYTETIESISLPAARALHSDIGTLVAKIERETSNRPSPEAGR